jgi:hypothetical protein
MIWPNIGPRNWEHGVELDSYASSTGDYSSNPVTNTVDWYVPYGKMYAIGDGCVYVRIEIIDYSPLGQSWLLNWEVPNTWGGTTSGTLGPFVTAPVIEVRAKWTNFEVNVDPGCNWTMAFDLLELQYSTNSGTLITFATFTNVAESGSNWDARLCADSVGPASGALPALLGGPPNCAGDHSLELTGTIGGNYRVTWGWRYDDGLGNWVYDICLWDNNVAWGGDGEDCDCYVAPQGIYTINNSWDNYSEGGFLYLRTSSLQSAGHEDCGGGYDWSSWKNIEQYRINSLSYAHALPYNFGVLVHRRQVFDVDCTGTPSDDFDETTTDAFTYGEFRRSVHNSDGYRYCMTPVPVDCPTPIDLPFGFCEYFEENQVSWPLAPDCSSGGYPDCIHSMHTNEYNWATVENEDIYVHRSQFSTPVSGFITNSRVTETGNCARPSIFEAPNGVLYVVYELGGDCVYRFSTDYGVSWSEETIMFADCIQPRVATGPNGEKLLAAFKYDSGSSGPGKIRVISIDPGGSATTEADLLNTGAVAVSVADTGFDISFSNDNHGRWLFVCTIYGDTTISHLSSIDYGLSVTDITP